MTRQQVHPTLFEVTNHGLPYANMQILRNAIKEPNS